MTETLRPDPDALLATAGPAGHRGRLKIFLGAAPGVGKTFAMLDEGRRRRERGSDVVVAYVETHGRAKTIAQLRDLELVPRRTVTYRGTTFEEMDLEAVLARRPEVALVDELAHTNVADSAHAKRWQDVQSLLDAGIDVISTVNVQHLESLNDVVEKITGITQRETVPDAVVRAADQIELVDMSPEALRRRMAHGNIYPAERIDAALGNYFRAGNLGALRELALLWAADRVEDALAGYRSTHGITDTWETRERVVVAVTGAPGGDALVRRAARIARRARGELIGVHVTTSDGLRGDDAHPDLGGGVALLSALGGRFAEVAADDVGRALVEFARAQSATQIVMGASRRTRWAELVRGSVIAETIRAAGDIDVHIIADQRDESRRPLPRRRRRGQSPIPRRRQAIGWAVVLVGLPLLTALLVANQDAFTLATDLLVFLGVAVAASAVGGPGPGITGALAGSLLVNYFLVPPVHTFTISERENLVALLVFVAVATTVSAYVHVAARRTLEARRARAETEALAASAGTLASTDDAVPVLLGQIAIAFGCRSAELGTAADRQGALDDPDATVIAVTESVDLVLHGPPLSLDDRLALRSHADQLAVALRDRALQEDAARAVVAREADELRTALLRAVSHDLRTPLAGIKASVTSLLSTDVTWGADQHDEFLRTIDDEADRLNRLVGNLLDMSRLQAGAVHLRRTPATVDDVVAATLASLSAVPEAVRVDVPDDLPLIDVDPDLLERALANVLANAITWSPPGAPVDLQAAVVGPRLHLRVVDRGPGIDETARRAAVQPFQRLGDATNTQSPNGVGLGLAVARGFLLAMGGDLVFDDTPGGGLTVVLEVPVAPVQSLASEHSELAS